MERITKTAAKQFGQNVDIREMYATEGNFSVFGEAYNPVYDYKAGKQIHENQVFFTYDFGKNELEVLNKEAKFAFDPDYKKQLASKVVYGLTTDPMKGVDIATDAEKDVWTGYTNKDKELKKEINSDVRIPGLGTIGIDTVGGGIRLSNTFENENGQTVPVPWQLLKQDIESFAGLALKIESGKDLQPYPEWKARIYDSMLPPDKIELLDTRVVMHEAEFDNWHVKGTADVGENDFSFDYDVLNSDFSYEFYDHPRFNTQINELDTQDILDTISFVTYSPYIYKQELSAEKYNNPAGECGYSEVSGQKVYTPVSADLKDFDKYEHAVVDTRFGRVNVPAVVDHAVQGQKEKLKDQIRTKSFKLEKTDVDKDFKNFVSFEGRVPELFEEFNGIYLVNEDKLYIKRDSPLLGKYNFTHSDNFENAIIDQIYEKLPELNQQPDNSIDDIKKSHNIKPRNVEI